MLEVAHDDRQKDFRTIDEILDDELRKMEKLSREGTSLTGTPSGFRDLDEITGGFQPGNLIVIAARPSMGKIGAGHEHRRERRDRPRPAGRAVLLEMSETELAQRFVASQGRIKGDELRKGRVPDSKWPKILQASARLAAAPLYIDDSSDVGIIEIRAKARRLHQQQPLGPDHHRLPAAHAPRRPRRVARAAGRRDEPRAEDPRPRAATCRSSRCRSSRARSRRAPTSARCCRIYASA